MAPHPQGKNPVAKNLTSFIACFRKDKKPTGKNLNKIQLAHTYKQYVAHSQQQQQKCWLDTPTPCQFPSSCRKLLICKKVSEWKMTRGYSIKTIYVGWVGWELLCITLHCGLALAPRTAKPNARGSIYYQQPRASMLRNTISGSIFSV